MRRKFGRELSRMLETGMISFVDIDKLDLREAMRAMCQVENEGVSRVCLICLEYRDNMAGQSENIRALKVGVLWNQAYLMKKMALAK